MVDFKLSIVNGAGKKGLLMKILIVCALTVLMTLTTVGCGGSKEAVKSEPVTITTTLGQELQDLDKAYKDGIITEKEYNKAKKALIENRSK
jgi:ABC-type glycerol-3-phosphate transport system substrate-binding protein